MRTALPMVAALPVPGAGHGLRSSPEVTIPAKAQTTLRLGQKWLRSFLHPYLNSLFKLLFNCFLINVKAPGSRELRALECLVW